MYNASDWYWIVAGDAAHLWSSGRAVLVALSDATYVAWLAAGNAPTRIASWGELYDVLASAAPAAAAAIATARPSALSGVQGVAASVAAGVAIVSTGAPAISGTYGIGQQDEINLVGLQAGIVAGAPWLGWYRDRAGAKHTMTAPQFTALATAILGYVEAVEEAFVAAQNGFWVPPPSPVTIA